MSAKESLPPISVVLLAMLMFARTSVGAEILVGDLGRREAIRIEGNETFTKEQILDAMRWHMDYHVAAHPGAPLIGYATRLEQKITHGYQHGGFPKVIVKAAADANSRQVNIRVTEGPRYRCGDLVLSGVRSLTNAAVKQKLLDRLSGLEPGPFSITNLSNAIWSQNNPAPFDEFSLKQVAAMIDQMLEDLGYYRPNVNVKIVPDPARMLADLQVEIVDEGIKGTIDEIEINGLRANTRQQVLDFLKIKPGMELRVGLTSNIVTQLASSARFLQHEAILRPLASAGKFKLELELEELREAPPLDQEFSPEAKALLKFRDWLMNLDRQAEDVVLSVTMSNEWLRVDGEAALATSGLAFAVRIALSNEPPQLKYAFVVSEKQIGFYSPWRKSKFAFRPNGTELVGYVHLKPNANSVPPYTFTVLAALKSPKEGRPFRMDIDLHPTVFIMENPSNSYVLNNGVLVIKSTNHVGQPPQEARIDTATGRLIEYVHKEDANGLLRIHTEQGVFARLLKEIAAATPDYSNEYITNHGFSSWLAYLATDLIESPLTERVLKKWIREELPEDRRANALATVNNVKPFLGLAREVLNKQNFTSLLEPWDRLAAVNEDDDDEDKFSVPADDQTASYSSNPMLLLNVAALTYSDALLPRDSWPWVLLRESAFTLAGQGKYAQTVLDKLLHSSQTGPLGHLATARLLGKMNPKLARTFAERGISQLTAPDFHKDYRALLEGDSIVSQMLANGLALARTLSDAQATALTTNLPPNEAALVRQIVQLLHSGTNQPAGATAWPAFEQHWDNTLRRYLQAGLNHFLPQVSFLTNSEALYKRGLALVAPNAALQDFDEAAQCFRKAAEQGHAGAQLNLGRLYNFGQGVRQDFAEAMRLYSKAAEQKEPHAPCHIADLYRDGNGVVQDIDEAARWYRMEAEGDCSRAKFALGSIYERQNKIPEALQWFRRAAQAGDVSAQAHLGDLLYYGFFTAADCVEACQWLVLAARAQDKGSEILLRRAKAKLSAEQWAEVQKRADAFSLKADAERGNARAQYDLGDAYRTGNGVVKDDEEAVKWYRKAAEQNLAQAQFRLGTFYSRSQGVTNDYVEAVNWYRKAAEQNLSSAQYSLGLSYQKGYGVVKNEVEAREWYRKAAEANAVVGQAALAWLLATSDDPAIRDGSTAVIFAEKAVAATSRKDPSKLNTLAAAHAEAGQFEKAVSTQKEAIALLKTEEETKDYTSRLKLYESGAPYRSKD